MRKLEKEYVLEWTEYVNNLSNIANYLPLMKDRRELYIIQENLKKLILKAGKDREESGVTLKDLGVVNENEL